MKVNIHTQGREEMKTLCGLLIISMLFVPVQRVAGLEVDSKGPESISAASAILIEPVSGRIIYEFNAREARPMASTTKIMTAVVAMELGAPEDIVDVKSDCVKIEGSSLYLDEGEHLTLVDLLYGLLLRSGNDAATAIGRHVAGDVSQFVTLMNRKAWELGMFHSNFANPHGLDDDEHYSSAYDMALVGIELLKDPILRDICVTEEYISRELTTGRVRLFRNNNKLLVRDPRSIGIKIGWTDNAGRCLVAAAQVRDMELVAVVLDAPDLYTDVSKLFDYGFGKLSMQELIPQGRVLTLARVANKKAGRAALTTAEPIRFPVFQGESVSYTVHMKVPDPLHAPLKQGEPVGQAWVIVDNQWRIEVDLVSAAKVEYSPGVWSRFLNWVRGWGKGD
jgi:D-alanyl-D-alanine carboxypeptidase (penicillin-binding protein 5/6)